MARTMGFFDVSRFVQTTIPAIESNLSVRVTGEAVTELVNRMRPHEEEVRMDLASGRMTEGELREILVSVIEEAVSISPDNTIDATIISIAMSRKCRYLGWC